MKLGKDTVAWNIAEVISSSAVLFLIYRVVVSRLGVQSLGIWSLVLSVTSVARLADLGAAGGLSRYIAKERSLQNPEGEQAALSYVRTAYALNASLYSVLSALLCWPAWYALAYLLYGNQLVQARALLPYSIVSFSLLNISSVSNAALLGFGEGRWKSGLTMIGSALQAMIAVLTVRSLGLAGLALAQVGQYSFMLIAGWLFLRSRFSLGEKATPIWPFAFDTIAVKSLIGFGARLQTLNVVAFLFDPLTKSAISKVSGVGALGMYELASRTILQARQVVITPAQNLTPLYTSILHSRPSELKATYARTASITMIFSAFAMSGIALLSPVLSWIWLGKMNSLFVAASILLAIGWLINVAASPAYMLGIATGRLRWNIVGSAIMSFGAPLAIVSSRHFSSWLLGPMIVACSLVLGGMTMLIGNTRDSGLSAFPGDELPHLFRLLLTRLSRVSSWLLLRNQRV